MFNSTVQNKNITKKLGLTTTGLMRNKKWLGKVGQTWSALLMTIFSCNSSSLLACDWISS